MPNSDFDGVDPIGIRSTDLSLRVSGSGAVDLTVNPDGPFAFGSRLVQVTTNQSTNSTVFVNLMSLPFVKTFEGPMVVRVDVNMAVINEAGTLTDPIGIIRLQIDGVSKAFASVGFVPGNAATPATVTAIGTAALQWKEISVPVGNRLFSVDWRVLNANSQASIETALEFQSASMSAEEVRLV